MSLDHRFEKLFRASLFAYYPIETGCPALYELAPFGGRAPLQERMARVLGQPPAEADAGSLAALYADYILGLRDVVAAFDLAPGRYSVVDVSGAIDAIVQSTDEDDPDSRRRAELAFAEALDTSFASHRREIDVTPTHLAMLRHATWQVEQDCRPLRGEPAQIRGHLEEVVRDIDSARREPEHAESLFPYPVATGDGKRPYGDRTYYYWDLEDLGVPGIAADAPSQIIGERARFSPDAEARVDELQRETVLALQALAEHGTARGTRS